MDERKDEWIINALIYLAETGKRCHWIDGYKRKIINFNDILELVQNLKNEKKELEYLCNKTYDDLTKEIERLTSSVLKYAETLGNEQQKSAEFQKRVDELENRFENKAHCNMSENCSMVQQAVKDTARKCWELKKQQYLKGYDWVKSEFEKQFGVEVE